jgi:very-short-patch-repair endonuclease
MSVADDLAPSAEPKSIFESDLPLEAKLDRARTELLDLSARNRLLNIPRSAKSAKTLEVVDERSMEVFRLLVRESKPFTFLPGKGAVAEGEDGEEVIAELALPDDDGLDARGIANRHADTKLQTRLTSAGLQKKLLDLYYDARTLEEEQGVNILFLALGTLRWTDPNNSASVRYAPLVLVPVELERGNAAEKFKLRARHEDISANLSLHAYLERVHGLKLPMFEADDEFDLSNYAVAVADAVSAKVGWSVQEDDIVLGFFSFAKFLMYRDLDPQNWPDGAKLSEHALIRPLMSDGFPEGEPLISEDESVDVHVPPARMVHIVDSDSSQTLAIEEVRRGRSLVIQGPPGTGKSQTIANVIASAVADGKRVLFVAEKMAALDVVKRRLDATGVGDACLELHSNKANKRAVLEELRRTWELGAPRTENLDALNARLTEARDALNAHAEQLHIPSGVAGFTPYDVIGHLVRLKHAGVRPGYLRLDGVETWTRENFRDRSGLVIELAERVLDLGNPAEHIWCDIGLQRALPPDVSRLEARLQNLASRFDAITTERAELAAALESATPETLDAFDSLVRLAHRLAEAPNLETQALAAEVWNTPSAIHEVLRAGATHAELRSRLEAIFKEDAWGSDVESIAAAFAPLAATTPESAFEHADRLAERLPPLIEKARRLAEAIGRRDTPANFDELEQLAKVSAKVAMAPDADPAAFAQDLWDSGVERASDLASAVRSLEEAKANIGAALSDAAWSSDLAAARQTLATHGSSILRIFNAEWRAADRLVRSFLADPKAPLERRLVWLDALGRGQAALKLIREDTTFGQSAFAGDWRGERSASAPLLSLVEWMRSLRGLGAEPRMIVARRPDRARISDLSNQIAADLQALRPTVYDLYEDLGAGRPALFGGTEVAGEMELASLQSTSAALASAHKGYAHLVRTMESPLSVRQERLRDLMLSQAAITKLREGDEIGLSAFGSAWKGSGSDWDLLSTAARWLEANADVRALASRTDNRTNLAASCQAAAASGEAWISDVEVLLVDLNAGPKAAITSSALRITPVTRLTVQIAAWRDGGEALTSWVSYRARAREAEALGLSDLVARLHKGELNPAAAHDDFEQTVFETIFEKQVDADPALATFDGEIQGRRVREFVDLDRQRIRVTAMQVAHEHHKHVPPLTGGAVGPLGVLKGEIARKRGHKPIRQLMQGAGPPIQALKPVFMMSPLSVAQFLPPGVLNFDLLVMDEASQIQPVDALGAIARCRQVVVVGDPQQLPPTAFFAKATGQTDDDDGDGTAKVSDIESILGLFTARGLPLRMLRWHYRSRHESLIAVSNRQFYENKLVIVPSPFTQQSGLGLRFNYIQSGIFESGSTRTNPIEAEAVAQAVIHHAKTSPDQSLGVVAFSAAQRKAILERLEILRRQLSLSDEAFFQSHPTEPFFVKNLENVQGDERDVILISVGYGPIAPGTKPPMRFGPVGQEGGERRLNVLISRAKRRCEVFSSMTDEDIDPDFASTRKGVFALKLFMHFARTGRMTLAESVGRDQHSVFEGQVAQALHERGYQVHRNVGVSGLFIDVAVADPAFPDRYLLAIECDGPSYRSARSARDRDRLRRSVLEGQGWLVHRIWSGDWFKRPQEQLDRAVAAIEAAKVELARDNANAVRLPSYEIVSVEREDVTEMGIAGVSEAEVTLSVPYVEAFLVRPPHLVGEIHEAPLGALSQLAEQVVSVEGPVHFDEIVARIRDTWGRGRAGARIREAVRRAVEVSVRQGRLIARHDFYTLPGAQISVRDRSAAPSTSLRKPEILPPEEIEKALIDVASHNFGATKEQAIQAVSRALGFKSTSAQVRDVLLEVLAQALDKGILVQRDSLIDVGPNAPKTMKNSNQTSLQQLIAQGEGEMLEFKQTLRWDVRANMVSKKVEDSSLKAIAAFANHKGGTLLIGVTDSGVIEGLASDLATVGGSRDKFEVHLTNVIKERFSESFRVGCVSVTYPIEDGKTICRVDVKRSRTEVYLTFAEGSGPPTERLIVRAGASSQEIPLSQVADYVREHFRNG